MRSLFARLFFLTFSTEGSTVCFVWTSAVVPASARAMLSRFEEKAAHYESRVAQEGLAARLIARAQTNFARTATFCCIWRTVEDPLKTPTWRAPRAQLATKSASRSPVRAGAQIGPD
jgi:hypothetical protein